MAKIGKVPTAKELGIPVSLSTVRGFVTKKVYQLIELKFLKMVC